LPQERLILENIHKIDGVILNFDPETCVPNEFLKVAQMKPNAPCFWMDGYGWTYGEYSEKSIYFFIGAMAVLLSRGAYCPFYPENPPKRQKYLIDDTKTSIVLTDQNSKNHLKIWRRK